MFGFCFNCLFAMALLIVLLFLIGFVAFVILRLFVMLDYFVGLVVWVVVGFMIWGLF